MVPGHEIAGVVSEVGSGVTRFRVGDRVGVGCMVDSCRTCDNCEAGLEQYCLNGATMTYNGIGRDGRPAYGGYAQKIVDENYVVRVPDGLALATKPRRCCAPSSRRCGRHRHRAPRRRPGPRSGAAGPPASVVAVLPGQRAGRDQPPTGIPHRRSGSPSPESGHGAHRGGVRTDARLRARVGAQCGRVAGLPPFAS